MALVWFVHRLPSRTRIVADMMHDPMCNHGSGGRRDARGIRFLFAFLLILSRQFRHFSVGSICCFCWGWHFFKRVLALVLLTVQLKYCLCTPVTTKSYFDLWCTPCNRSTVFTSNRNCATLRLKRCRWMGNWYQKGVCVKWEETCLKGLCVLGFTGSSFARLSRHHHAA